MAQRRMSGQKSALEILRKSIEFRYININQNRIGCCCCKALRPLKRFTPCLLSFLGLPVVEIHTSLLLLFGQQL